MNKFLEIVFDSAFLIMLFSNYRFCVDITKKIE